LQILQIARNQDGLYVVNPMHVLLETNTPKHLLIVGPFDTENNNEHTMMDAVRVQMIAFGFEIMTMYYLSID
jgi:hypothetical protein